MSDTDDETPRTDDRGENTTPGQDGDDDRDRPTVRVGLISDPGLPTDCLGPLADELADDLSTHITGDIDWEIEHHSQPLVLDTTGNVPIVRLADRILPSRGWDLVVFLTDLPRRLGTTPVVADLSIGHSTALVSMPAIGGIGIGKRLRDTLIYLVGELGRARTASGGAEWMRHRAGGRFTPVRWTDNPAEEIEAALALTGWRGRARLLSGMVRDNRPWRLVPELSTALAAGFAVAAFGIFYSSIWTLADSLSPVRHLLINILAVVAMVGWLIYYNNLWQPRQELREKAWLYNAATVLTLAIGVLAAYVTLFAITLVGAFVVIEPNYLGNTLGHSANLSSYLILAWLSTSMGTVAGAVGSSLESEQAVHRATYSKRERERRESEQQQEQERQEQQQREQDQREQEQREQEQRDQQDEREQRDEQEQQEEQDPGDREIREERDREEREQQKESERQAEQDRGDRDEGGGDGRGDGDTAR
ncbi:hypothetical protein [Saccharomonospora iraqiensis]|uniref:hypothetical protein n=1 Tax=Saccharomonospora iraqiensis TaxID=52698 RepID=UPI00042044A0|nr:hypothetical protein [Saccharomonospora iraqiensis]